MTWDGPVMDPAVDGHLLDIEFGGQLFNVDVLFHELRNFSRRPWDRPGIEPSPSLTTVYLATGPAKPTTCCIESFQRSSGLSRNRR